MDNKFGAVIAGSIIVLATVLALGFHGYFDPAPVEMQKHKIINLEHGVQVNITPTADERKFILSFCKNTDGYVYIGVEPHCAGLFAFPFDGTSYDDRTVITPGTKSIVVTMSDKYRNIINVTAIDVNSINWDYEPKHN